MLKPLFENDKVLLVSHDIKRDMVLLHREDIGVNAAYFDTSLAHYVLQPEMRHRLAEVVMSVLHLQIADYAEEQRKGYAALPTGEEVARVCQQADVVRRLHAPLRQLLEETGQLRLLEDIELPLARVLAAMEITGVRIDPMELARLSKELTARVRQLEEQVYELAGCRFNISSPMQVGEILFGQMKLDPKAKRTKKRRFLHHRGDSGEASRRPSGGWADS